MTGFRADAIADAWELAKELFDDKSTEFMIAWVSDHAGVERDTVMDWLASQKDTAS